MDDENNLVGSTPCYTIRCNHIYAEVEQGIRRDIQIRNRFVRGSDCCIMDRLEFICKIIYKMEEYLEEGWEMVNM